MNRIKQENHDGLRRLLWNVGIRPHGSDVRRYSIDILIYVPWQRRGKSGRRSLIAAYLILLLIIIKTIMLSTARTMPMAISQAASGPAPNTIGNGPMKITPPKLVEPLSNTAVTRTIITPTVRNTKPRISNMKNLLDPVILSSSFSDFSPAFFVCQLTSRADSKRP